jgi:C1A family cysteine protease
MALTGYTGDTFEGHNSWGTSWGNRGAFTIPGAYLTDPDLAADFWTIQKVEA